MVTAELVERRIVAVLPDARVHVSDLTGGGDHFQVEVVSAAFAGVGPLKRHRMVYDAFTDLLGGAIHAMALTTRSPAELAATEVVRA